LKMKPTIFEMSMQDGSLKGGETILEEKYNLQPSKQLTFFYQTKQLHSYFSAVRSLSHLYHNFQGPEWI
jgi:hypothetical protein